MNSKHEGRKASDSMTITRITRISYHWNLLEFVKAKNNFRWEREKTRVVFLPSRFSLSFPLMLQKNVSSSSLGKKWIKKRAKREVVYEKKKKILRGGKKNSTRKKRLKKKTWFPHQNKTCHRKAKIFQLIQQKRFRKYFCLFFFPFRIYWTNKKEERAAAVMRANWC